MNMRDVLKVKGLCKAGILRDVSFTVGAGEMVAVMGPSGSGKSTLLYNVSGMDQADAGEAWLGDTEIVSLPEEEKAKLRLNRTGFVFQQMNVLSNLNILDNVMLPALYAEGKRDRAAIRDRALALLEAFGIAALADRAVTEVSGGQLQRACICRSMILQPELLFADEPTGALNRTSSEEVMEELTKLNDDGTTIMLVTHDSKVAAKCTRVLFIVDGNIKGEYNIDKSGAPRDRERDLNNWLMEMGW